jgi:uncharacterized protein (DUF486 family)
MAAEANAARTPLAIGAPRGTLRAGGRAKSLRNGFWFVLGLTASNVFMTIAWYGHLKSMSARPWIAAALLSWLIAFFEYLLQVPANRVGYTVFSVAQLKIIQECIALVVFVPFAVFYLRERPTLNYLYAGLCVVGAVYFIFRDGLRPSS